jgi:hypothetical protein
MNLRSRSLRISAVPREASRDLLKAGSIGNANALARLL